MSKEILRIGYYACQWGLNISAKVNCSEVAEYMKQFDNIETSRIFSFLCTEQGQKLIMDDIKEKKINRVVAAAWTPRTHEPIYRESLERAGLSKFYFQMVNIREQCSWITEDEVSATNKAKILSRAGYERAKRLEIVPTKIIPIKKATLVVGGGIAGLNAALDLANQGIRVYLIESKTTIGGRMAQLDRTFPTDDCSIWILGPKMLEANRNENIEIISYSEVDKVEGYVGNYEVTIKKKPRYVIEDLCNGCGDCTPVCPIYIPNYWQENLGSRKCIDICFGQAIPFVYDLEKESCVEWYACVDACEPHAIDLSQEPEYVEIEVGTIIVATGWDLYNPIEYGYGEYQNVINEIQLERILAPNGPTMGHVKRPSDGKTPKEILFIQCVGSRDTERAYCSGVCCMIALKNAKLLKEEIPDCHITICYIDIRASEKNFEEYYMRTRDKGIDFIRGKVPELIEDSETKNLKVRVYSSLTDEIIKIDADLVVLSTAVLPSKGTKQIADVLGIDYDTNGYLTEHHFGLSPQETKYLGIYICGFAQGPKNISYSVSQARATASKVAELTSKGEAELELICAIVDEENCISCCRCEKNCPKNAIIVPEGKIAEVDEINCDGCGICATCCPTQAIQIRYYTDEQIFNQVLALVKEENA